MKRNRVVIIYQRKKKSEKLKEKAMEIWRGMNCYCCFLPHLFWMGAGDCSGRYQTEKFVNRGLVIRSVLRDVWYHDGTF